MKNILITGGAGFIGSNLATKLVNKGYNITVLDNLSPQIHGENPRETSPLFNSIQDKVKFIEGSVNDRKVLSKAIEGQDIIVHFAAETGTGQSMYEINKYTDINIGGTSLLLDILTNENHHVSKVVVASSRSIYGEGKYMSEEFGVVYPNHRKNNDLEKGDFQVKYNNQPVKLLPTDEESKIHPSSVYGITKQVQEQLVMTVCPTIGISPVALRYQNVYGPGQSLSNPYTGILSIFSTRLLNGNGINIFEDGLESRDFVYIEDVVDATILAIEKEEANGNVYNVGSGVAIDVLTVAQTLASKYGINATIEISGNYRLGDIRHNYADLTKIKKDLDFGPKVKFQEGIEKFTNWVKEQKVVEDRYEDSIKEMKEKGLYK